MLAENLRLQTVEQVVFLIVGEHTLVVEHPTPSFKLTAGSWSRIFSLSSTIGSHKKAPGKPIYPKKKENRKCCAKQYHWVWWTEATFLPLFFPIPMLLLAAHALSTKDLLRLCSSSQVLNLSSRSSSSSRKSKWWFPLSLVHLFSIVL